MAKKRPSKRHPMTSAFGWKPDILRLDASDVGSPQIRETALSGMGQSIDRDGVSYGFALALDGSGGHEDGVSTPG